ncbi:MAG TPA: tetratricopeptide repeat protein [Longimicrobiales bacterium]
MADPHRDEIAKLEALFAANPDGRIFTHLAEAYRKAGDLERARETVERGLERHAEYPSAHVVLARVLHDQGDLEGAERAFRRVLELDPENRVALRGLGDLARADGRAAEALGHYRAILLLDPSDGEVEALVREVEGEAAASGSEGDAWFGPADAGDVASAAELGAAEATMNADPAVFADPAVTDGGGVADEGLVLDLDPAGLGLAGADLGLEAGGASAGTAAGDADALSLDGFDIPGLEAGSAVMDGANYDAPVVTETMADLYARQGLHEQAAEVYRELLRTRPGDEGLEAKLRDAEARAAAAGGGEDAAAGAAPGLGFDAGLDSGLDAAWLAPDAPGLDGSVPPAGAGATGEEAVAPGFGDPLAGLEPGAELQPLPEIEPLPGIEPLPELEPLAGGDAFADAEPQAGSGAEEVADPGAAGWAYDAGDALATQGGADAPDGASPWAPQGAEAWVGNGVDGGAAWGGGGGVEPGGAAEPGASLPELVLSEVEVASDAPQPTIGEYLRALLAFGGEPVARDGSGAWTGGVASMEAAEAGPAAEGEAGAAADGGMIVLDESAIVAEEAAEPDEFDRLFGQTPPAASGGAGAAPAGAAPSGGEDDDEDLEMFRAWLQNLKH